LLLLEYLDLPEWLLFAKELFAGRCSRDRSGERISQAVRIWEELID
jgi:hypothetical protein